MRFREEGDQVIAMALTDHEEESEEPESAEGADAGTAQPETPVEE